MKLIRIRVENFGTLSGFEMNFSDGINTVCRENGWGKTTLAVFLKAMLYGLPATVKRSLDENERKKYAPWQGGAYGGSLEFSSAKGRFRVERFFGAKESEDSFDLFDLSSNVRSDAYSARLGEELFGIDAESFERTVYLSQRVLPQKWDKNNVTAKLGDLLDDTEDINNYDGAVELLEKRRRYYQMTGDRGRIPELTAAAADLEARLAALRRKETSLAAQERILSEKTRAIADAENELAGVREDLRRAGLAREQAALSEQKHRMLSELGKLSEDLQKNDAFFRGRIPAAREVEDADAALQTYRNKKAGLDALATPENEKRDREELKRRFPSGAPDRDAMRDLDGFNGELRSACIRLESAAAKNVFAGRFPDGAPREERIAEAFRALDAAKAEKEEAGTIPPAAKGSGLFLGGAVAGIAGIALIAVALCGAMTALFAAFGAAALAAATVFFTIGALRRKHGKEADKKREKLLASAQKRVEGIRQLLAFYHFPTEGDPTRALTELSLLAAQYRDAEAGRRNAGDPAELLRAKHAARGKIRDWMNAFAIPFAERDDYSREIEEIRRGAGRLEELERAEDQRVKQRSGYEKELADCRVKMDAFFPVYDPQNVLGAAATLTAVRAHLREHERLTALIPQKEEELKKFLAEKDPREIADNTPDYGTLSAREQAVTVRLNALREEKTNLAATVASLTEDVGQIPSAEDECSDTRAALAEAKENLRTILTAEKMLEDAKTSLSTRYLGGMQESFRQKLSALCGDTPDSYLDASFEISLRGGGKTRPTEAFSRGWQDAVGFCIRLSLAGALFEDGEKPFLLLDDPFVNFDDRRSDAANNLLRSLGEEYQILYLVCRTERVIE